MFGGDLKWLAVACALLLVGPGASRAQGTSDLRVGPLLGGYWPGGTPLYTLVEPVDGGDGAERLTSSGIEEGGLLIGLRGSLRPGGWPLRARLTLGQVRGAEARTTSAVYRPCEEACLFPIPPSTGSAYASELTITVAQLDAVVEPLGRVGPLTPQLLLGVATRHHEYGTPRFEETLGAEGPVDRREVRFPDDGLGVALQLGSAVSVPLLGRELSVEFGDHVSVDARTVGENGRAEAFLRHDLYLGAGFGLF